MLRRPDAVARSRDAALEGLVGVAPLPAPTPKSGARVVGGHAARDAGAAFEAWLSAQHRAAELAGLAHVRHVGPPVAHTGIGGRDLRVIGHGPADYQGVIRGGRAVAVEAKSRTGRLARAEIPQHQQDDLARVAALGGVALLVVELRDHQLVAAVPWGQVPWMKARTAEAVGAEQLRAWVVSSGSVYLARFVGGGA